MSWDKYSKMFGDMTKGIQGITGATGLSSLDALKGFAVSTDTLVRSLHPAHPAGDLPKNPTPKRQNILS